MAPKVVSAIDRDELFARSKNDEEQNAKVEGDDDIDNSFQIPCVIR